MATDYDAPRSRDEDVADDSLEELTARRATPSTQPVDDASEEVEAAGDFELPGADLSHEELSVQVLPRQADEFTCGSCFLVKHRSQFDHFDNDLMICAECAG